MTSLQQYDVIGLLHNKQWLINCHNIKKEKRWGNVVKVAE